MQNLTHTPTNNQAKVSGAVTPEIAEALRMLRASEFRLEAEYFHLDIESRFELAADLRATLDDLDDRQADEIARVAADLEDESEDFSEWETRADASARIRRVVRSIESESKEVAHA
jgi:DNA-binding transcriptional regulator GbsR (MarR family)